MQNVAIPEKSFAEQAAKQSGETSQSTIGDTTISETEEAVICVEVREFMRQKFDEGRATLRTNLGSHNEKSVKSGTAMQSESVIDLATYSTGVS